MPAIPEIYAPKSELTDLVNFYMRYRAARIGAIVIDLTATMAQDAACNLVAKWYDIQPIQVRRNYYFSLKTYRHGIPRVLPTYTYRNPKKKYACESLPSYRVLGKTGPVLGGYANRQQYARR